MNSKKSILDDQSYKNLIEKDLFELMGFINLSDEKKTELGKVALETIEGRVLARILGKLSENEQKELEKMFDNHKFDKATQYIIDKNFDIKKIFAEEMIIYKNEMMQSANLVKKHMVEEANKKE